MLKDRTAGLVFADMSFRSCFFDNCLLSKERLDGLRTEVCNVRLEECKLVGCNIGPALLSDAIAVNSTANGLTIFWGSLFRRVKFVGRVSAFKINKFVTSLPDAGMQAIYDNSRREFYKNADWAIDISEARFTSFDCEGIPARLFRLDLETQGVVRRENVPADWRTKFYDTNAWGPWVSHLLGTDDSDAVFPTHRCSKRARQFATDAVSVVCARFRVTIKSRVFMLHDQNLTLISFFRALNFQCQQVGKITKM